MPVYRISGHQVGDLVPVAPFLLETHLQSFIEQNLEKLFELRFVARQLSGSLGIADTVALDQVGNPVVIEYKVKFDRGAIQQGLDYRTALDEDGTQIEAEAKRLGRRVKVRLGRARLIVIAPAFTDEQVKQARKARRVELWRFQKFEGVLLLEDWLHRSPDDEVALRRHTVKVGDRDVAAAFMDIREHVLQQGEIGESIGKTAISYQHRGRPLARFKFQNAAVVAEVANGDSIPAEGWRDLGTRPTYRWQYRLVAPATGPVPTKPITDALDRAISLV